MTNTIRIFRSPGFLLATVAFLLSGTAARAAAAPGSVAISVAAPVSDGMGAFNVEVSYTLSRDAFTRVTVSDSETNQVGLLVTGKRMAGTHTVTWHARGEDAQPLPAGKYLIRILSAGAVEITVVEIPRQP